MEMSWVLTVYWVCLIVGIGYTLVSAVLGGLSGHGVLDIGHGDFSHDYGVGGSGGHGEASGSAESGPVLFGPFSPLVIAFFLTCFGATGIMTTVVLGWSIVVTLLLAAVSGFALAWLLIRVFNRFLGGMQTSSEVQLHTLVGSEAEVTVNIPVNDVGEIAYIAMGSRYVAPARSEEQVVIPRFSGVRITRIVGNMFYVRPLVEDQLRDLDNTTPTEVSVGTPD